MTESGIASNDLTEALDFGFGSAELGIGLDYKANRDAWACVLLRRGKMKYISADNAGERITAMVTVGNKVYVASGSRVFIYDPERPEDGASQMTFRTLPDERGAPCTVHFD